MKPIIKVLLISILAVGVSWFQTAIINQWFTYLPVIVLPLTVLITLIFFSKTKTYFIWAAVVGLWTGLTASQAPQTWIGIYLGIAVLLKLFYSTVWNTPTLPAVATISVVGPALFATSALVVLLSMSSTTAENMPQLANQLIAHLAVMTVCTILVSEGIKRILRLFKPASLI